MESAVDSKGERRYSDDHIWIVTEGDNAVLGITDHAQEQLGGIMFINLPDVGDKVRAGQRFGDVESIKTVSDLISPVNGEVIGINENAAEEPELVNEDPYENWLIKVRLESAPEGLMDENEYNTRKEGL